MTWEAINNNINNNFFLELENQRLYNKKERNIFKNWENKKNDWDEEKQVSRQKFLERKELGNEFINWEGREDINKEDDLWCKFGKYGSNNFCLTRKEYDFLNNHLKKSIDKGLNRKLTLNNKLVSDSNSELVKRHFSDFAFIKLEDYKKDLEFRGNEEEQNLRVKKNKEIDNLENIKSNLSKKKNKLQKKKKNIEEREKIKKEELELEKQITDKYISTLKKNEKILKNLKSQRSWPNLFPYIFVFLIICLIFKKQVKKQLKKIIKK